MTDSRRVATGPGWLQNYADTLLNAVERIEAKLPAHELQVRTVRHCNNAAANEEVSIGAGPPWASIITSARIIPDAQYITAGATGGAWILDKGTVGTLDTTMYLYTAAATLTALKPAAFTTASATLSLAANAGLSLKRTTVTGGTAPVAIQLTMVRDITAQTIPIGVARGRMSIKRVTVISESTNTVGDVEVIKMGTAGTGNTTVATKSGAALTGGVPYTLTLSTTSGATTLLDREVFAMKRATASVWTLAPMGVEIEYHLTDTE